MLIHIDYDYNYMEIIDSFETLDNDGDKSVSYVHNSHANLLSQCLTPTHLLGTYWLPNELMSICYLHLGLNGHYIGPRVSIDLL